MKTGTYPTRDSHFAHKFTRLLFRVCAAQDIGIEAVALLTMIVHTEDAKRYRAPVTFWNHQIESILNMSWGRVDRARAKAVECGWLHYESGGKGRVGKYWVTIPAEFDEMEDTSIDEDVICTSTMVMQTGEKDDLSLQNGDANEDENHLSLHDGDQYGEATGGQPGDNRGENADLSTLRPNPTPNPNTSARSCSTARERLAWNPEDGFIGITNEDKKLWNDAYPACNLDRQLAAAHDWLIANPRKATKSNWRKFISGWLSRQQDRGGDCRTNRQANKHDLVLLDED